MRDTCHRTDLRFSRQAFTLIELLIVMMIIGLLATILIPSLHAARTAARVASSKALIFTLESAVNMFRADEVLGDYPPSFYMVYSADRDPYSPHTGTYPAFGAQTLLWGVCGADLLGSPGFPALSGLRDVYGDTNTYPRRGPFVDPGKLQIVRPNIKPSALAGKLSAQANRAPVILDSFKMPVLYYRADTNHQFHATDNEIFAEAAYDLDKGYRLDRPGGYYVRPGNPGSGLNGFITDLRLAEFSGTAGPYNRDSFILISAGPDKLYGTSDDVANFPVGH